MKASTSVQRRRILFLLPFAPRFDAMHGGGRVMAQLLSELADRHDITLLYLRAGDEPQIDTTLRDRCIQVEEVLRPGITCSVLGKWLYRMRVAVGLLVGRPIQVIDWRVPEYLERLSCLVRQWQPDIVQIEFHVMSQYLSALDQCPAPRILTEYEVGMSAVREQSLLLRGYAQMVARIDSLAWARFEAAMIRQMQAVIVFTERDQRAIESIAGNIPIVRIPFGTYVPDRPLDPLGSTPASLVFIGSFIHPPNVDAAARLITSIFPRVCASVPDVTLYIVGDQPPPSIRRMASERVIITGRVPDVMPYLDQAALVVVPLRLGGGMRVKVLEALAAGKAVVASRRAIEGLDLVDGEQIALAESDEQFAGAITMLLANPVRRGMLADHARAWACDHLGWDNIITRYENLYQRLIDCSA